ncbi:MAG TPA: hypothetical protein PLZ57_04765 [Pseudobdellovibrionaceae bacterium]|nr:hypothetical protein [Pseudobdellovibrionaceae bacterium]
MDGIDFLQKSSIRTTSTATSGSTSPSAANPMSGVGAEIQARGPRQDRLGWIKELVRSEMRMEETGVVDMTPVFDPRAILATESLAFIEDIKTAFIDACSAFNQLKSSALGRVKIYAVANTHADFMLFRNGYKLIVSVKEPGAISLRFVFQGAAFGGYAGATAGQQDEDVLIARWGAFGDLTWTYQDQPVKIEYLVRYYLTRFIRESAR